MPCPYFEPQRIVMHPQHPGGRLPLISEYEGACHADGSPVPVPLSLRFRCCNHGYSRGSCDQFPADEARSSLRYSIVQRTETTLEVLYVEEQDYAPLRWHAIQYFLDGERLMPEVPDVCARAQVLAFCRSYVKRFAGSAS
ncbi:MAG: hypothetical protein WB992_01530 [Bryobacteraceae bacterium]